MDTLALSEFEQLPKDLRDTDLLGMQRAIVIHFTKVAAIANEITDGGSSTAVAAGMNRSTPRLPTSPGNDLEGPAGTRGRGRPPISAEDRHQRLTISLAPDLARWLRSAPEGPSQKVAEMIRRTLAEADQAPTKTSNRRCRGNRSS